MEICRTTGLLTYNVLILYLNVLLVIDFSRFNSNLLTCFFIKNLHFTLEKVFYNGKTINRAAEHFRSNRRG